MGDFKAIIFDMDGTLVDSEVVWEAAEDEMFAERNIPYTDDVRQQVIGLRLDDFFTKLIDIYDLDETIEDLSADLIGRMLAKIPTMVEAKPGAEEIIAYAQASGLPYCIASSSSMAIIKAVVKSQGWEDKIRHLYTANDVARGKPAPDVYLYAAQQLGVDAGDCIALEDSPNGARSAVSAGMTCYAIPDTHSTAAAFADITPHVFDDLHQVLARLKA